MRRLRALTFNLPAESATRIAYTELEAKREASPAQIADFVASLNRRS